MVSCSLYPVRITVTEGRNRLIRRMMQAVGHPVSKLRRESFGTVSLRGMERGEIRPAVAARYPLEEIVAAQEAFLSKGHVGKIVLLHPT